MQNWNTETCKTMDRDYEEYDDIVYDAMVRLKKVGLAILLGVGLCVLLSGCKTQYVPVETVHHEYHHTSDTIRERDSIFNEKETIIRETNSGDSALLAKLGIQLSEGQKAILILQKELERLKSDKQEAVHDTIIKNDTIQVPYPVEKKLGFWEKAKLASVGFSASVILIAAIGLIIWIRRRYRYK